MDTPKTFSIAFLVMQDISPKLIMNLFASLPEEFKSIFVKREVKFVSDKDMAVNLDGIDIICPILTANCLQNSKYVEAVAKAYNLKKTFFMIYDANIPFPGEKEQPGKIKHLFENKIMSLYEEYSDRVWRQLASKVQLDPNEEVNVKY